MSSSSILSSLSLPYVLQLQYGEEDFYFQNRILQESPHKKQHQELLEQLVQDQQTTKCIPWNVRFRLCLWILRQQQQQPSLVGKKRKRVNNNNNNKEESNIPKIKDEMKKLLTLVLEGIYLDLRLSCNQSFEKKKEQLWNQDCMLRTWLLLPTTYQNTTTTEPCLKLLGIQTGNSYRIGMARYSCTSDILQLFPSNHHTTTTTIMTHDIHNHFPLQQQQQQQQQKKEIILTEQPIISDTMTTQTNQDQNNHESTILELLKQIIQTLDNFIIVFHTQLQQQQQQQHNQQYYDTRINKNLPFVSQDHYKNMFLYDDENPIVYNHPKTTSVSPFTQYNPRLFADKKKRRNDKQRDRNNISLFQMHSHDISIKYTRTFEERKQIEEQMNKAIKDGRGRYYMEYLLFDLLHSKDIIDITNDDHDNPGKRKQTNEKKFDNITYMRGRALLVANLRELLGYTHRHKLKTFIGESTNSTKKNKRSSTTLQPSPLPSFFGMTKQEFSNSIWQKKITSTNNNNNNNNNISSNNANKQDDPTTTHNRPYPQAPNWKIEEAEEENFDEPQMLSSTIQTTNNDEDTNGEKEITIRVISSISEIGLEVCLENFLKGTNNSNERIMKPLSLSNIFDGFTSLDQNLINGDKKDDYQIPDVTDLLNDLFDVLVHKSILSSQSSSLDEIDAVAEKHNVTTFAKEDVDTILQMAKQFGMWLPLNPLVEKFRICLRILLLSRNNGGGHHNNQVERHDCHMKDKWTSDIAGILQDLSLSSKVSLLLNLVKFYGAVFQSTHLYGHDNSELVQSNYFSNLCFSWYSLLDKRFCDIDLLELGWESDLSAFSFFSSSSSEEQQQQHFVTMKSTTTSKLILSTLMEGIFDSIKRCYDVMKVVKKVSSNDAFNGLKNLVWCVHSMTAFFPYCLDTSFGIENIENKTFYDKVIIVNDRLRKICDQIWTNLSLYDGGINESMKSNDSLRLDLFDSNIDQKRGSLSFEMYTLQLISFALNSKWKDQQPTSWCKHIVYNIIGENYLSTNSQHDCKNDRNTTFINPCCMLKKWIEQVFIALMKKQTQMETDDETTKQEFQMMTPLLKGIHQCIIKMLVLRGGETVDLKVNRLIPLESVDHVSRMIIRLQHVGKRRFSPSARLLSWNEIFCNTDARYLFRLVQSCCQDETGSGGSAESIVEKCLHLSNNSLPILIHLFVGVGMFVDNELKRLQNGPEKEKKMFFHHIQYYRTEFHNSSSIKSYLTKMKPNWQNYNNDSTWVLLAKRVYFQLKSNGASLGFVWWKNLMEEMDAEPTVDTAKKEEGSDTTTTHVHSLDGWDNISIDSEKTYTRNGISVDNMNHQFWPDHKLYSRSNNVKSESRIEDDFFQKE